MKYACSSIPRVVRRATNMSLTNKMLRCRAQMMWVVCCAPLQFAAPPLLWAADSPTSTEAAVHTAVARHGRGFIADPAGYRKTEAVQAFRDFLPSKYDLSADLPPPGNQGDQSSCVAWSVGYAARTYYLKHYYAKDVTQRENALSPAYIYNSLKSGGDCENGLSLTGALNLLQKSGGVPLSVLPYDPHQCLTLPSAEELSHYSDRFRIRGYRKVRDEDDIKGELYRDNPVVFAIDAGPVFDHYHSGVIDTTEDPGPGSAHAMVIVGYDDDRQAFHFVNSWGPSWGEKGFGWISYRAARALWIEGYVMDVAAPPAPPTPSPAPPPQPSPVSVPVDPPQLDQTASCSRVSVTSVHARAGFTLKLSGFVGKPEDLDGIRNALLKQSGYSSVDSSEVSLRPWPQCEALITLSSALAHPEGMALTKTPDKPHFVRGDEFSFEVRSPGYPSYLYVAYVQSDGSAKFLLRPVSSTPTPPNTVIRLGEGPRTVHYKVGPPYGSEMVVALASDQPLLGADLPIHDRQLLTAYRRVLPQAQMASAAIVTLDTTEQ
jgi:C1A family cysteine protease